MITLLAPAKLNLCLRVCGKTDSGLHDIDSIVVFCEFGDKISISPASHDSFFRRGPFAPSLTAANSAKNLVLAARDAFRANGGEVNRYWSCKYDIFFNSNSSIFFEYFLFESGFKY